jgi:hypothetical protein
MWDALARYQPYADTDGHGETWRVMCSERTADAAGAAANACLMSAADYAEAAAAKAAATDVKYLSDRAIARIEDAIKERT